MAVDGRRLWRAVTRGYELNESELQALGAACSTLDELRRLEHELATSPLVVRGSRGQPVVNELIREVRAHRLAIARLLSQVGIADVSEGDSLARSSSARHLALVRWKGTSGQSA